MTIGTKSAGSIDSTCTASGAGASGVTTITGPGDAGHAGATVRTSSGSPDNQSGDETYYDVPPNPDPDTVVDGTLGEGAATYQVILNEQVINPDGSITVTAVHLRLLGPTAVGDLYIGRVVCGTGSAPTTDLTCKVKVPTSGPHTCSAGSTIPQVSGAST